MKAAVRDRFGTPDVVELRELEKPVPAENEVLVRVRATSVNPADWYEVTGRPYVGRVSMGLRRPRTNRLGTDYAGEVEAVGAAVTRFAVGDRVFGGKDGAFAEYVCAREDRSITPLPESVSFEDAAAAPVAAVTALQGLRDKGGLQPGQRVLVNGASGGVGTYAVQIAKALGGAVTAVCSTANVETAGSLRADQVVDYTQDDFTRGVGRYDLYLDIAGSRSWKEVTRVLEPDGTVVLVGGPKDSKAFGPLAHVARMRLAALRDSRNVAFFIAKLNRPDLQFLAGLLATGELRSVIDRTYGLGEIREALRYLGEGHARGKVVLTT